SELTMLKNQFNPFRDHNRFTKYHTLSGNDENNPAISTDLGSSDARTGTTPVRQSTGQKTE
ncbi:hypothetical protein, partial [Citrobacter koseri]|uniref:hypothetical protein n=1 Tax=Citrobacter koseri TaxID=545 RepID=UPI001D0E1561